MKTPTPPLPSDYLRALIYQRGVSLIELMIGMLISLLLVAGMITLFVNNRQTYRYNEEMARIQENARFATEYLQRNLRMAGHLGCGFMVSSKEQEGTGGIFPASIINPAFSFDQTTAISGEVYSASAPGPIAATIGGFNPGNVGVNGTDVISIIFGSGAAARPTGFTAAGADIVINSNALGFNQGELVLIADCKWADLFRISNVPGAGNNVTLEHKSASGDNLADTLANGMPYDNDARVMRLQTQTFYLGPPQSNFVANPPFYSLYVNGTEMVQGIANLAAFPAPLTGVAGIAVQYGLPAAGTPPGPAARNVVRYVTTAAMTAADWANVITVRIELLLASTNANALSEPMPVTFNGQTATAPDRRMYSTVSTTIALRNRF